MKFVTDRISTRKAKSFDDLINEFRSKREVKTASSETVVKTAEKDEADSSGQLDVEPLHQTGESTTMPKNGPNGKKEGTEKGTAKASTDPEAEGKDSGQPKAEGSEKFTNDPEVKEEAKGGSSKTETKVAEAKCEKCDCPCSECKCEKCECEACVSAKTVKEAGIKGNCSKCGKPNFLCKGKCDGSGDGEEKNEDKKDDDKEEDKEAKVEEEKDEKKEASNKKQFVKISSLDEGNVVKAMICLADQAVKGIGKEAAKHYLKSLFGENKFANLNSKNREFLKTYFRKLYGEDFVNDMVADK